MVKFGKNRPSAARRTYAAATALRKAATVIRARASGLSGLPRTGGFYGNYSQFRRGSPNTGRELKFIDTQLLNSTIATTGSVTLLNGVAQGTDFTQRIGRKTIIKSVLWNGGVYPTATTSAQGEIIRLLVVYDTQTNSAAAPAITDILATADPTAPMNLNNRDRFHVLMDKKLGMNAGVYAAGTLTTGSPGAKYIKTYKKCHKEIIYSGTGATVGSIQTGAIWLLTISLINSNHLHNSYFRFRFFDS
jgi:hypothetical protein